MLELVQLQRRQSELPLGWLRSTCRYVTMREASGLVRTMENKSGQVGFLESERCVDTYLRCVHGLYMWFHGLNRYREGIHRQPPSGRLFHGVSVSVLMQQDDPDQRCLCCPTGLLTG